MFWSRNKQLLSKEAELLLIKVAKLEQEVATLRFVFDKMETNYNSLRGFINRKFGGSAQNLTAEADSNSQQLDKEIQDLSNFLGLPKEKIKSELGLR